MTRSDDWLCLWFMLACLAGSAAGQAADPISITGELRKWHRITLTLDGPATSESATPNPFTDYRLDVTFANGGRQYVVPGYYAADGNAADTGADRGNKWRVHFAPSATGKWSCRISFRKGPWIAVSDDREAGTPVEPLHALACSFDVGPTDKTGRDNRGRGKLRYVGKRYLQWAETGEFFLKQGADSPENFLAYADFDGDFASDGHNDHLVKTWEPHVRDWRAGDPTWRDGQGKGIIGALNYLASKDLNAISFLTMNIAGDDRNVFPYTTYDERERLDVSRLEQWEIVFEHADRQGLYLHFKTQETENETLLDRGDTGPQRRLYYRELIARVGHHLALNWNLGEENGWGSAGRNAEPTAIDQNTAQRIAMAQFFHAHDPYGHLIVIHNGRMPDDLLGKASALTGFSLQTSHRDFRNVHREIVTWIRRSAEAGKPWVVACDEPGDHQHAVLTDEEDPDHDEARVNGLWGCLLGGGAGNEWYFGYKHPHSDLTCQDWRSRHLWWDQCRIALGFFDEHLPFAEMSSHDALIGSGGGYCLARPGQVYAILVRAGATIELDLGSHGERFRVAWFDPRAGGDLQPGTVAAIRGPGRRGIGRPPHATDRDWIALVRRLE